MPDVEALKAHQNKLSYVSSAHLLLDSLHKNNSMVGSYTEDLENQQNCQNWEVGALRLWMLARDNTVLQSEDSPTRISYCQTHKKAKTNVNVKRLQHTFSSVANFSRRKVVYFVGNFIEQ